MSLCFFFFILFIKPVFFLLLKDSDHYYDRIHLIFLEQNPSISSFDIYRPSWEYLKDCPKYISISKALQSNPVVRANKKKQPDVCDLVSPEGTSGSDDQKSGRDRRPLGNKLAKRKLEEEHIMDNVATKLKQNVPAGGSGKEVALAIKDFSSVISSFFADWQEKSSYQCVDPALRKTYEELKIKEKIMEMQRKQRAWEAEERERSSAAANQIEQDLLLEQAASEAAQCRNKEVEEDEEEAAAAAQCRKEAAEAQRRYEAEEAQRWQEAEEAAAATWADNLLGIRGPSNVCNDSQSQVIWEEKYQDSLPVYNKFKHF